MKKITLLFLFIYSFCNAQYYTKHYIAPSPWQYWSDANEIVVSTLSTTTVNVDLYKSNGVYITTLTVTAANPVSYRFIGTASAVSKNDVNTNYTDRGDRKSTRLNSSHVKISYAVFCLKKKKTMVG